MTKVTTFYPLDGKPPVSVYSEIDFTELWRAVALFACQNTANNTDTDYFDRGLLSGLSIAWYGTYEDGSCLL